MFEMFKKKYKFGKKRYCEKELREVYDSPNNLFKNLSYDKWKEVLKKQGWLKEKK